MPTKALDLESCSFKLRLIGKIQRNPYDVGCFAFTKCLDRVSYCIRTTRRSALGIVSER